MPESSSRKRTNMECAMETLVRQLIADSMELEIPPLTPRRSTLPEVADRRRSR